MSSLEYRSVGMDGTPWPEWIRDLKGTSGVYVIKAHGHNGKVLYVGSSAGKLYDTITRHFQSWRRSKRFWRGMRGNTQHDPGTTYSRSLCCVAVRVTKKSDHFEEEAKLIQNLEPRDNLVINPDGGDVDKVPF